MCVFVIKKTIVFFRSKGELNLAGFFPPSDQNSFWKNNSTISKKLRNFLFWVGGKNEAQKKHKSQTILCRGEKSGKSREKKCGQKMENKR